jgi:pilus assembly protein CpaB
MRKAIPYVVAALVFLIALALVQPEPTYEMVVASRDLPAGHTLESGDVEIVEVPERLLPVDAIASADEAIGQMLAVDRAKGDAIRSANLGEPVQLQPDERAIAVHVTDSAGMAGLMRPGDSVGLIVSLRVDDVTGTTGTFTKAMIEPVRVLYLSPEFQALDPDYQPEVDEITGLTRTETREQEGTVMLAVSTDTLAILYDFKGSDSPNVERSVNALELLAAMDSSSDAVLSLYLVPEGAAEFSTSGLYLPDLVVTPGPTPTNTPTPDGYQPTPEIIVESTATPSEG